MNEQPDGLTQNPFEQMVEAIKRGLMVRDGSHRKNPHSRKHSKKYADGRQKRGRASWLARHVVERVPPQPSLKARERKARRANDTQVGQSES